MGSLERVPCLHVDNSNVENVWPHLMQSIESADFIALDLVSGKITFPSSHSPPFSSQELSGIGRRQNFSIKDVSERYEAFTQVAKERAILSIGICTMRYQHPPPADVSIDPVHPVDEIAAPVLTADSVDIEGWSEEEDIEVETMWPFSVTSFNIMCKCTQETVMEEEAEKFLQHHGFDFDRQQAHGIPYTPAHVIAAAGDADAPAVNPLLSDLFDHLVKSKKAIVFHNGFIDLVFLYQSLYLNLPTKFGSFICNVNQLFPSGIYDTKYITDIILKYNSSFLEYVYYHLQRQNVKSMMEEKVHIFLNFPDYADDSDLEVEYRNMKTRIMGEKPDNVPDICKHYSRHGWCIDAGDCIRSHNIDLILDRMKMKEERLKKKSSKSLAKCVNGIQMLSRFNESLVLDEVCSQQVGESDPELDVTGKVKSGAHRSGYDAFMTAYAFACIMTRYCNRPPFSRPLSSRTTGLKSIMNCVFLSGKDMPLKIRKGNYDKTTADHDNKLAKIRRSE